MEGREGEKGKYREKMEGEGKGMIENIREREWGRWREREKGRV